MQVKKQQLELDMKQLNGSKLGKECQGYTFLPCLFKLYADDTTLMPENEEELKTLLMKVKEEKEKTDLKFSIQKTKIMASGPITSWQIVG